MKGALAFPTMISSDISSRMTTSGKIHQILFCQAKAAMSFSRRPMCLKIFILNRAGHSGERFGY